MVENCTRSIKSTWRRTPYIDRTHEVVKLYLMVQCVQWWDMVQMIQNGWNDLKWVWLSFPVVINVFKILWWSWLFIQFSSHWHQPPITRGITPMKNVGFNTTHELILFEFIDLCYFCKIFACNIVCKHTSSQCMRYSIYSTTVIKVGRMLWEIPVLKQTINQTWFVLISCNDHGGQISTK